MQTKNLNFTGRKNILREYVEIELFNRGGKLSFTLKLNLSEYYFSKNANVFIKAHYSGCSERFSLGTVGNIVIPKLFEITEVENTNIVDFNILVVGDESVLQGVAWNIRIGTKDAIISSESLLPVNIINLGHRPWNIQFTSSGPILELNVIINDIKEKIENDPVYRLMIFSGAYRNILERIVYLGEVDSEEDNWQSKWLNFTKKGLGITETPKLGCGTNEPDDDQEIWINQCVDELCHKKKLMEKLLFQETY